MKQIDNFPISQSIFDFLFVVGDYKCKYVSGLCECMFMFNVYKPRFQKVTNIKDRLINLIVLDWRQKICVNDVANFHMVFIHIFAEILFWRLSMLIMNKCEIVWRRNGIKQTHVIRHLNWLSPWSENTFPNIWTSMI